jgi:hypothetical protein
MASKETIVERLGTLGGGFFVRRRATESRLLAHEAWRVYRDPVFVWIRSDGFDDDDVEGMIDLLRDVPHLQGIRFSGTNVTSLGVARLRSLLPGLWVEGVCGV